MKKVLVTIATIGIMGTSFQAQSAIGLLSGGTSLAITGLIFVGSGHITNIARKNSRTAFDVGEEMFIDWMVIPLGYLFLNGGQEVQFKKVAHNHLLKMGLTVNEALAYNDNTEELSQAFKLVQNE